VKLTPGMFVPGTLLQPSLMFVGKAEAYPSEALSRHSTLGWAYDLARNH